MGRGAVRGAFTAWLALIALHTIGTRGGSGRVAEVFDDVAGVIERALDPKVPGIRDRRLITSAAAEGVAAGRAKGGSTADRFGDRFGGRLPSTPPPSRHRNIPE